MAQAAETQRKLTQAEQMARTAGFEQLADSYKAQNEAVGTTSDFIGGKVGLDEALDRVSAAGMRANPEDPAAGLRYQLALVGTAARREQDPQKRQDLLQRAQELSEEVTGATGYYRQPSTASVHPKTYWFKDPKTGEIVAQNYDMNGNRLGEPIRGALPPAGMADKLSTRQALVQTVDNTGKISWKTVELHTLSGRAPDTLPPEGAEVTPETAGEKAPPATGGEKAPPETGAAAGTAKTTSQTVPPPKVSDVPGLTSEKSPLSQADRQKIEERKTAAEQAIKSLDTLLDPENFKMISTAGGAAKLAASGTAAGRLISMSESEAKVATAMTQLKEQVNFLRLAYQAAGFRSPVAWEALQNLGVGTLWQNPERIRETLKQTRESFKAFRDTMSKSLGETKEGGEGPQAGDLVWNPSTQTLEPYNAPTANQ
jgi:hypothetical protein